MSEHEWYKIFLQINQTDQRKKMHQKKIKIWTNH